MDSYQEEVHLTFCSQFSFPLSNFSILFEWFDFSHSLISYFFHLKRNRLSHPSNRFWMKYEAIKDNFFCVPFFSMKYFEHFNLIVYQLFQSIYKYACNKTNGFITTEVFLHMNHILWVKNNGVRLSAWFKLMLNFCNTQMLNTILNLLYYN